ncbi:MAG TPA: hypothetical protein VNJ04_12730 [Gemmatimonadaceae bacterium]|nr:hypothetical protein [Gemmatimonadaceae bacterium]
MRFKSDMLRGTILGLLILGIGSRALMRVAAHIEGRLPAFTVEGTITVVALGTVSGAFAGLVYYLTGRFMRSSWARTAAFFTVCLLISWRGVHGVMPVSQAMFMALSFFYLVVVDVLGRRARCASHARRHSINPATASPRSTT